MKKILQFTSLPAGSNKFCLALTLVFVGLIAAPHAARAAAQPSQMPGRAGDAVPASFGGNLVTPRSAHTATLLADGRVLLAGGAVDGSPYVTNAAELYNPATNNWTATGGLNQARYVHGAVLLPDGRALIMGGQAFGSNTLNSAELYDPVAGTWSYTANMSVARGFFDPVVLPNGKVLVAGGRAPVFETDSAELYDPATGTWAPTGSLVQPRSNYRATLLSNGKVLIAGGFSQTSNIAETELYDPATGTFSSTGSLSVPRFGHIQILLADGRVLTAGGHRYQGNQFRIFDAAEIYDPATGLWTRTRPMRTARTSFTGNLLSDGMVLVAGGTDSSNQATASIEEFNPAAGTWRLLNNSLSTARVGHTATTLFNGDLIVAGGFTFSKADLFVQPH
jgi:hypothetical protein